MFSRPVEYVAGTKIFARALDGTRQAIVYQMTIAAAKPVAMVLPIPVPIGADDDAVRFVDLSGYPRFFDDLAKGFPPEFVSQAKSAGPLTRAMAMPKLEVHAVGLFEASFVPRVADFERLDPRFRLSSGVFDSLPAYRDYGFAVFQLRGAGIVRRILGLGPSKKTIHPMAFVFPRREPNALFFPTVHVHDGEVHARARFDHTLYAQGIAPSSTWDASDRVAAAFIEVARAAELIDPQRAIVRRSLIGDHPNEDVVITA